MVRIDNKNGLTLKDLKNLVEQMNSENDNVPVQVLIESEPESEITVKSVIGDNDSIIFYDFI